MMPNITSGSFESGNLLCEMDLDDLDLIVDSVCYANETFLHVVYKNESRYHQFLRVFAMPFVLHFCITLLIEIWKTTKKIKYFVVKEESEPAEEVPQTIPSENRCLRCFKPIKSLSCPQKIDCDRKPASEYTEDDLRAIPSDQNGSQENVLEYRIGGYKPTFIGEDLGDYSVIRKLGFGHFSTVWLCSDKRECEKYVAVKIVKAVHMCDNMAREEIKLLNQLVNIDPDNPGRKNIIEMMDYFHVNSVNGKHVCIAFELMGPSLLHLITQSQYQGIYEGAVKSIIKQVLLGLSYLHNKCKVIHTDLKPENILIKVNDVYIKNMVDKATRYSDLGIPMPRSYITSECYENQPYDARLTHHYVSSDDYDNERIVRSSSFPQLSDLTTDGESNRKMNQKKELYVSPKIEVKIADMGNACWQHDKIDGTIQTKQYRALEVLLGTDYDFSADIWSVGCIAFELATGEFLFNPRHTQNYTSSEDHILLIYELLGGIPPYIASRGKRSNRYFDSSGVLKICSLQTLHIWKTEDVLVEKYEWKRVDAIPFASMINAMVEPDPELRITADNALTHQWLSDTSS